MSVFPPLYFLCVFLIEPGINKCRPLIHKYLLNWKNSKVEWNYRTMKVILKSSEVLKRIDLLNRMFKDWITHSFNKNWLHTCCGPPCSVSGVADNQQGRQAVRAQPATCRAPRKEGSLPGEGERRLERLRKRGLSWVSTDKMGQRVWSQARVEVITSQDREAGRNPSGQLGKCWWWGRCPLQN